MQEEIVNNDDMDDFDLESLLQASDDESELDKIFKMMLDQNNIHHVTELSRDEIRAFSILQVFNKKYNFSALEQWLTENLKLRVSLSRSGRKEIVKISSRNPDMSGMLEQKRGGFFRRD